MKLKIINKSRNALPAYETPGSAGLDLRADIDAPVILQSLQRMAVPTGLFIELPAGMEAQIRPRSGLAAKKGLTCLNSPGTIDSDYRGEIKCILVNLSDTAQQIEPGERICQMVVARYEKVSLEIAETLSDSERGMSGFGSTGNF